MRKIFSFLILVFFVVGCSTSSSDKTTIEIMFYGSPESGEGESAARIIGEFEELYPEIAIEYTLLHDEAYHNKVLSRIVAGNIPHIAYMGSDARWGKPWNEADLQIDMKPYLDPEVYDYELISFDNEKGDILYIPLGTANICTVLFVNEKALKELGLQMPKTYADLKAMVPAAKRAGKEVLGTHGADSWVWGSCFLSTFVARTSGDANWIQKALSGECRFTDDSFVKALDIFSDMVNDGILSKESVLIDSLTGLQKFNNGDYLIYVTGQWDAANVRESLQKDVRLIPFPELPYEVGCKNTVAATKQCGYGLTRYAFFSEEELEAAVKFLHFYYGEKETVTRLKQGGIVAPILKNLKMPEDLLPIAKEKADFAMKVSITDVIDSFLTGNPNTVLCEGVQSIITEKKTSLQIATEVENMVR